MGEVDLARKISAACHLFHLTPAAALRQAKNRMDTYLRKLVTLDRLDVFVCTRATILPSDDRLGLEFRPLNSDDFGEMHQRTDRFGEQARLYYEQRGISSAFGVFVDGELGHISWVYTAKEYCSEPYERFRLGIGEAEIVNCFTADTYRGKGLYPHAVRKIAELILSCGFERVFITTEPGNVASRRGILKTGFARYGQVVHLRISANKKWRGWYWLHKMNPVFKAAV